MKVLSRKMISITVALLCSFFVCISLQSIHVKYIKGTFGPLKKKFEHCSPAHGAAWWESRLLHKYYDFGDKKDATIQLIRDMFHVVQGGFSVTTNNGYTAKHFSARTLGKILGEIERWKREKVNPNARVALLIALIREDADFQESIGNARMIYEELLKQQKNLGLEEPRYALMASFLNKEDLKETLSVLIGEVATFTGLKRMDREVSAKWYKRLQDSLYKKLARPADVWQKEVHKAIKKRLLRAPMKQVFPLLRKHGITTKEIGNLRRDFGIFIKKLSELSTTASEEDKNKFKVLIDALNKTLNEEYVKSEVAKEFPKKVERIKKIVSVLKKALLPKYRDLEKRIEDLEQKLYNNNTDLAQGKRLQRLAEMIVRSLEECGYFKTKKQPLHMPFMTHSILLGFLYRKAITKEEFRNYFTALTNQLKQAVLTDEGKKIVDDPRWLTDAFSIKEVRLQIEKIGTIFAKQEETASAEERLEKLLQDVSYEKLIFTEAMREGPLPEIAQYSNIDFEGIIGITDCVETTIRNLLNIILYDLVKRMFSLPYLQTLNVNLAQVDQNLKAFYQKYADETTVENPECHQAWGHLVQNRSLVTYLRLMRRGKQATHAKRLHGTQGFIYGIKVEKNMSPKQVTVNFDDGASAKFMLVTIHGGKYVIVDPKEYVLFSLLPSLRNVIILLNDLLGMSLYENRAEAFNDPKFNSTYFRLFCKMFGWDFNIKGGGDLDKDDLGSLELEIEISKIDPLFTLHLKATEFYLHGYLMPSPKPDEPNITTLFYLLRKVMIEKAKGHTLDTINVFSNLLAVYNYEKAFEAAFEMFRQFPRLVRHLKFVSNLHNHNIKIELIDSILKVKPDNKSIAFVVRLIDSLPIMGNFIYQKRLMQKILLNKSDELPQIEEALRRLLDKVWRSRGYIEHRYHVVIELIKAIQELDPDMLEEVSEEAKQLMDRVPNDVVGFYQALIEKGQYKEGQEVAKQLMKKENFFWAVNIYLELIEAGQYKEAQEAVEQLMEKHPDEVALLYKALIGMGQYYKEAKEAAKWLMGTYPIWVADIYVALIDKGQYEGTIEVAEQLMKKDPQWATNIYVALIKQGQYYKEAVEAVKQLIATLPFLVDRLREVLIDKAQELMNREQYEEVEKLAKQLMEIEPSYAVGLYRALIEKGQYKEAKEVAKQLMKKEKFDWAVGIYFKLIEVGQYKEAQEAAEQLMEKVLSFSLQLFNALAIKKQVPETALAAVKKGTISFHDSERIAAEDLKKILIHLGKWPGTSPIASTG